MTIELQKNFTEFLNCSKADQEQHLFLTELRAYISYCIAFHVQFQKNEIDDITQECFMKVIKQDLAPIKNIKGYVATVARNVTYDYLKAHKNQSFHVELEKIEQEQCLPEHLSREKIEVLNLLKEIIDSMNNKCKTLLDMHQYKTISDSEISNHLALAVNQIPQNRLRCLTKLKEYLEKDKQSLLEDLKSLL